MTALLALAVGCGDPPAETAVQASAEPVSTEIPPAQLDAAGFCELVFGSRGAGLDRDCSEAEKSSDAYKVLRGRADTAVARCTKELRVALESGRARVLEEPARNCAAAIAALSWRDGLSSESLPPISACRGLVLGKQEAGQACRGDHECAGSLWCRTEGGGEEGTCESPVPEGQACVRPAAKIWGQGEERASCADGCVCSRQVAPSVDSLALLRDVDARRQFRAVDLQPIDRALGATGIEASPLLVALSRIEEGALDTTIDDRVWQLGEASASPPPWGTTPPKLRLVEASASGLPKQVALRIVRAAFPKMRRCYHAVLEENGDRAFDVELTVTIGDDGAAKQVDVDGGSPFGKGLETCLADLLGGARFPRPDGAAEVKLTLAFEPPEEPEETLEAPLPSEPLADGDGAGGAGPDGSVGGGGVASPAGGSGGEATGSDAANASDGESPPVGDRVCAAALADGDTCARTEQCAMGSVCSAGRCTRAEGKPSGASCAADGECAFGLFCDVTMCAPLRATGEACQSATQCQGVCVGGTCAAFCGAG